MAEDLDLRYAPQPSLQEGFIDKQTGLPLSFGLIFSYKNQSRNQLKPIFELQEALPGGPVTYVALPNPIILSGVGTIQNQSGDDVIPYFFPFEADGITPELYYIIVTDQYGTVQFTREAFPNASGGVSPSNINFSENFIPNAQFLLNNPPDCYDVTKYTFDYGAPFGVNKVIDVAPGGWTYQVNNASTSVTAISFHQFTQPAPDISAAPRYEIRINRTSSPTVDTVDDLRIRFMDVNKFQANSDTDKWTLIFNAISASGSVAIDIRIIKYFGTSGTSTTPVTATEDIRWNGPFTINSSQTKIVAPGTFGSNVGKSTGTNNDDFVELAIRFPTGAGTTFNVSLTDFMLVHSDLTQAQGESLNFPVTTNGEFVLQALSNLAPTTRSDTTNNYYQEDGSNLYLPIVMTKSGFTYDDGEIGNILAKTSLVDFNSTSISTKTNELLCDGAQYRVSDCSPLGIPYRRLFNKLIDTTNPLLQTPPPFGGGIDYVNALDYTVDNPDLIFIMTNKVGTQTAAANGAVSPGFTYPTPNLAQAASLGMTARANTNQFITVLGNNIGPFVAAPVDGTGGLLVPQVASNSAVSNSVVLIQGVGATAAALSTGPGNPAKFISLSTTTAQYSFWFNVVGEAANGPGAGIPVFLDPAMLASSVAAVLSNSINAFQTDTVRTVAAGIIPPGSYFTFTANGTTYNVWYKVAGVGTAPALNNLIEVDLAAADTAAGVAFKTTLAINSQFFAVPDLRGLFLRGWDPTQIYDHGFDRVSLVYNQNFLNFNTWQMDAFGVHHHLPVPPVATGFIVRPGGVLGGGAGGDMVEQSQTGDTGYYETRPVNQNVVWAIKY